MIRQMMIYLPTNVTRSVPMKFATRSLMVLSFAFCLIRGVAADEFRWAFKPGDKFQVSLSQKSVLNSNVNRTDVRVQLTLGTEMDWEIVSTKPNGNALIKQSFTRMKVKVEKTSKPTIEYDTAYPDQKAGNAKHFAEVYDKLVGISFQVEMSNRGEIVEVVFLDKKDQETIRSIPESMEARQLFEKRGLMKILNSGGFMLPEKDIAVGYKWPVRKQQKMSFGTADFESIFTYQGTRKEDRVATFDMVATARLKDQPKNPLEKPLELKSQSQTGSVLFDVDQGFLKSIASKQEMVTEKPFREMKINTTSVVENRLTIARKN